MTHTHYPPPTMTDKCGKTPIVSLLCPENRPNAGGETCWTLLAFVAEHACFGVETANGHVTDVSWRRVPEKHPSLGARGPALGGHVCRLLHVRLSLGSVGGGA